MESNSKTVCGILPESKLTFVDVLTPFTQKSNGTVGPPKPELEVATNKHTHSHAHTHTHTPTTSVVHSFLEERWFSVNPQQFSSKECSCWIFGNESTHSLTSFRVSQGHLPRIYSEQDYTCIMVTSWLKYTRDANTISTTPSPQLYMMCIISCTVLRIRSLYNYVDCNCKLAHEIGFNICTEFSLLHWWWLSQLACVTDSEFWSVIMTISWESHILPGKLH
jgi:hypothetical protein